MEQNSNVEKKSFDQVCIFLDQFLDILPETMYKTEYITMKKIIEKLDTEIINAKHKYESDISCKNKNH